MVVYICLKSLILFILFWECEPKFFEIKGLQSQRRSDILDTENGIEDTNSSNSKEINKGTTEDSQIIRLTNISINNQPAEKNLLNNTNNAIEDIDIAAKMDKNNSIHNLNQPNVTNDTIQDYKPLQETHVFISGEESTVPVLIINESSSDNISTATAVVINNTNTDVISLSNNKHESNNVTTELNATLPPISTNGTTIENSQIDINIKMKTSDDSISIIDIKTSSKQSNNELGSGSITYLLKKFANQFMKILKGIFSFKRFNDSDEEQLVEDNYNLYVPISEDVSRMQYNSAEKQHVNVLREGALSLLGNDRNNM